MWGEFQNVFYMLTEKPYSINRAYLMIMVKVQKTRMLIGIWSRKAGTNVERRVLGIDQRTYMLEFDDFIFIHFAHVLRFSERLILRGMD